MNNKYCLLKGRKNDQPTDAKFESILFVYS